MRRLWIATDGIRFIMACFLIMSVGMFWMIGCGSSDSETSVEEPEVSWEQEAVEEGYYYGYEAAHAANKGLEIILCEDGYVGSPNE